MKQTLQQHAKDALDVQNACNLSAVVHSFDAMIYDLWEYANKHNEGTHFVNTHPIVQAYVDKIASLSRVQQSAPDYLDNIFHAFETCRKMAKE